MKVGNLIKVNESRACGGIPNNTLGLVIEKRGRATWVVRWLSGPTLETVTYGIGMEIISEGR